MINELHFIMLKTELKQRVFGKSGGQYIKTHQENGRITLKI